MSTKRLAVGILGGLVVLLPLLAILQVRYPAKSGIDTSLATCEKLHWGMREKHVETIIGGPAGKYTSARYLGAIGNPCAYPPGDYERRWETDEGTIIVRFDTKKRAVFIQRMRGFVRESFADKTDQCFRSVFGLSADPDARYRLP